jgi:hypothetical protein
MSMAEPPRQVNTVKVYDIKIEMSALDQIEPASLHATAAWNA